MPGHIVIDVRRLSDYGIGTYIRNLTRALSEIDQENRYTLVTRPGEAQELRNLGPNFRCADYTGPEDGVLYHLAFPRFIKSLRPDLCHIPLNSVAYWMPRPYVVTIHDMSTILFPLRKEWRETLHEQRYWRGAARAARIITVSNTTRRDIQSVLRIPHERIQTIYSAPDPAFTQIDFDIEHQRRVLERYSIHRPFILYAGSVKPQKNIPRLVEAFAVVRNELKTHPDLSELKLVIIGDDISKSPAVRRAVIATRMDAHVRFLGFVPIDTLKVFYRAARLFAFPSLYEGFGLAPLEAMLCGTPVLTSNLPALMEAVGDAAELVSPDNVFDISRGLRELLLNEQRRCELVSLGMRRARQFDWKETARSVAEIYREIIT